MRLKLLPLPFFVGFGLGLLTLSWLGATVRNTALAENFVRFHQLISPEAGYFATAREARAIVEHQLEAEPKIHLIVGGTSVFQGAGQHESLVWTRRLQEHLGPQFRVLNLAQRGGMMNAFGNIAAELLLRDGRPVIYLGDGIVRPLQTSSYRRAIFDAWNRHYLIPYPPRDKLLSDAKWHDSPTFRTAAWGALLDTYLNFNDFWNFVAYEYANSNWDPLLRNQSFRPRRELRDPELMPDEYARRGYHNGDYWMAIVRRWHDRRLTGWQQTEASVPPKLRAVTFAAITFPSAYYVNQLTPGERDVLMAAHEAYAQRLRELGYERVVVSGQNFTEEDYVDGIHLSVSGGHKLAVDLAPAIRQMAQELGYLP